jgi:hypothetical protein
MDKHFARCRIARDGFAPGPDRLRLAVAENQLPATGSVGVGWFDRGLRQCQADRVLATGRRAKGFIGKYNAAFEITGCDHVAQAVEHRGEMAGEFTEFPGPVVVLFSL